MDNPKKQTKIGGMTHEEKCKLKSQNSFSQDQESLNRAVLESEAAAKNEKEIEEDWNLKAASLAGKNSA